MSTGTAPHYLSEMLPGWMIGGAGVGLALPTILAAATADLPPHRAATGSAVVNMSRQIGTALGVAVLVAVLGTATASDVRAVYASGWWIISGSAILGALAAFGMTPSRRPADTPAAGGEPHGPAASDRSTAPDQSAAR
nr:hypothetical protein OG781_08910 [Streptomyces sp. NBC_00830]